MSYYPKKGMYRDKQGVARFEDPGHDPLEASAKRWYKGEVVRKVLDKNGEVVKKDKQSSSVYATEESAARLLLSRCPTPWQDGGDVKTNVYFRPATEADRL